MIKGLQLIVAKLRGLCEIATAYNVKFLYNTGGANMTFGEKLKFLRKQKGFSQERLSQQLTVSRQAISKWELGESLPDTEKCNTT